MSGRSPSRIPAKYYHPSQSTERAPPPLTGIQVKRILVPQRENPIVNRLNKTKVEKKPDLKQEKDDRQRELRKREQAAQQLRVSLVPVKSCHVWAEATAMAANQYVRFNRRRKRPGRRRSGRRRNGKRIMPTTISSPRRAWLQAATRTVLPTGKTTSCEA